MNFTIDVDVPESRELTIRVPATVATGRQRLIVSVDAAEADDPIAALKRESVQSVKVARKVPPMKERTEEEIRLSRERYDKWLREHNVKLAEFERLFPELMALYPDQFVALHQGQVIAHGFDKNEVEAQVDNLLGKADYFLKKVTYEKQKPLEVPSLMFHLRRTAK